MPKSEWGFLCVLRFVFIFLISFLIGVICEIFYVIIFVEVFFNCFIFLARLIFGGDEGGVLHVNFSFDSFKYFCLFKN